MRGRSSVAAAFLLVAGLLCPATEPPPGFRPGQIVPPPSIHEQEWRAHRALPTAEGPGYPLLYMVSPAEREEAAGPEALTKTVYGFMPYWSVSDLTHVRWDLLTHVAYFSVDVNPDGSLGAANGWPSGTYVQALLSAAHANGVKVTLAATLMNSSDIGTLLGSATYRQNAINNLLSKVQAGGGDGVNIDFEGVPSSQKANLVTFMTDLAGAFHSAIPGSHVSLDTPAVDWSGAFDYDLLAAACDGMFIMGYDYHWSSDTQAGPCAPLTGGSIWGTYNVTWTVNDYITYGGAGNVGKFLLGVPYYGYEWPTSSTSIPSAATGAGSSKTYNVARGNASSYGRVWDVNSQTPYYTYSSGGAHQGWYDDAESLGLKWDLVKDQGLGGTGMWALNYDTSDDLLWDQLAAKFSTSSGPLAGRKICLDPGHGGTDPGAVGPTGLEEAAVNLGVATFLKDALEAQGASVYLTRTADVDVGLLERCDYANAIPADRFESVHHNASGTPSANYTGVHIYSCSAGTSTKDMASKTALRLNTAMGIGVVSSNCSPSIYGVHADGFTVLVNTNMPAMLTEGSFISNPTEEGLLKTTARRCTEAGAVAKGIEDHYGVAAAEPPCSAPDTVGPAPVKNVRFNRAGSRWEWDPVTVDRQGNPETMGYYQVWRSSAPDGSFTLFADNVATAYAADAASPPATTCWYYYVHDYDAAGNRDNPDQAPGYASAAYSGTWNAGSSADCSGGTGGYKWANTGAAAGETATWSFTPDEDGTYNVFARFVAGGNRTTAARYTVNRTGGNTLSTVNQTVGGCTWVLLGRHFFLPGQAYTVVLDAREPPGSVVVAEAVSWVRAP